MKNKLLIHHDQYINIGGAEKLTLVIKKKIKIFKTISAINKKTNQNLRFFLFNHSLLQNLYIFLYFFTYRNFLNFFNFKKNYINIFSANYPILGSFFLKNKIFYANHLPKFAFDFFKKNEKRYKKNLIKYFFLIFYKKLFIFSINRFDKIIFNSQYTKKNFEKYLKKINPKTCIVHPPCGTIHKNNLPKKNGYIINISRYTKEKNLVVFFKLVKIFKNKKLILVKSTNIKKSKNYDLYKKFKNLKIFYNLPNKKIASLMKKSSFGVFTGLHEDYGMFLAELFSYSLPILCVNSGFAPFLVKNKFYGYVSKNNIQDLVKKFKLIDKYKYKLSFNIKNNLEKIDINSDENFIKKLKKEINL